MQANNFNIDFLNQFHQQRIIYPGKKELQYKNLLFRQFVGKQHEIPWLATSVDQKLHDSEIISHLITNLENENLPDFFTLLNFAQNLRRQISSNITNEPFTINYYRTVLGILKPFIILMDDFHEKTQQVLLNRLKALHKAGKCQGNNTSISGEEAADFIIIKERFLDNMYDYYNDFSCCISKESEGLKGVIVTSHMQQFMTKLVLLIEKLMYDTRSTQTLLEFWKVQLAKRELQMIYN